MMASDGDMMHGGGGGKFDGRGAGDYDEGGSGVIGTGQGIPFPDERF